MKEVQYSPPSAGLKQRQRCRLLDFLQGNFSFDILNAGNFIQALNLKFPVGIQIRHHNAQEKIAVARHQLALHHLIHGLNGLDKSIYGFCILPFQPDPRKNRQA